MTTPDTPADAGHAGTARLEAFSDGVFAIAITLLVLEIRLPPAAEIERAGGLAPALLALWPSYAGYVVSFVTVGIMWANHHELVRLLTRADHGLIVWNLLLLMAISFTPFPTAVMAEHLPHPGWDRNVAVAFYCGSFTLTAIFYNLLWRNASHRRRLIHAYVSDARVAAITPRICARDVSLRLGHGHRVRQRPGRARHRGRACPVLHPAQARRAFVVGAAFRRPVHVENRLSAPTGRTRSQS